MKLFDLLLILMSLLIAITLFCLIYSVLSPRIDILDNVCKNIGFEEFKLFNGISTCKDKLGNIHFVDMDCNFFMTNCKAKEISIGGVFTK